MIMSEAPPDATFDARLLRTPARRRPANAHLEDEVTALFDQWRGALLRYLATFNLPPQDAEEVVQEAFLALFSHLQCGKARTNLPGWLFRVTHNLALKRRDAERKTAVTGLDAASLPHPDLNPEQALARYQRHGRLTAVLQALRAEDRQCLYLRAEGLRYREIAEVTGMSLGSVAASLARSLARFQRADER